MRFGCAKGMPGARTAILFTLYHGYWKNLALALVVRMNTHSTALWDHGHIKFWSIKNLSQLLREAGFVDIRFERAGRVLALAKSMIAVARKPASCPILSSNEQENAGARI